ncbi:2013_t:CDS:2, partial [Entrophospora sp. SA101]
KLEGSTAKRPRILTMKNINIGEETITNTKKKHASRSLRSLESSSEPVLQGIVECLLDPSDKSIPELCLVVNKTKKKGEGHYGFIDIFIPPCDIAINQQNFEKEMEISYSIISTMKYIYWSKNERKPVTTTVGEVFEPGLANTVIKGDAKRSNSGVCSKQIKIEDNGKDRLKGYVVMVIGRKDILTHSTAIISTCFNYNMAT